MKQLASILLLCVLVSVAGCADLAEDNSNATDDSAVQEESDDGDTDESDDGDTDGSDDGDSDVGTDSNDAPSYTVTVTDVVDGDTLDFTYRNGSTDTVRLLGVDTPEIHTSVAPDAFEEVPDTSAARDCLGAVGERASSYVRERLAGETVTLRLDPAADRRGLYGRVLGYVIDDGSNLNHDLVTEGYARVFDSPFGQRDRFYDAEREARADGEGVWSCRTVARADGDE